MKAIVKTKAQPKSIEMQEISVPKISDEDVLIQINKAGICGTDYHIHQWDTWSRQRIHPPIVMGHELAGTIKQVGKNVTNLKVGQRVSAEGHIVCRKCRYCLSDQAHICENVQIIGVDIDGCFAEYIKIPAYNVWPLGDHITDKYGAIMDPLGNAMHTVMAQPIKDQNVLITGAGSIGLFAVAIARREGAKNIIVSEPNALKRSIAKKMGADLVLDPMGSDPKKEIIKRLNGYGPDVALEMSGAKSAINMSLDIIAKGGNMALLGIPSSEISIDFNNQLIFKGVTLRGINGRRMFQTWQQCDDFLKHYAKDVDDVITHEMPMEEINQGLQLMEEDQAIKIVLHM